MRRMLNCTVMLLAPLVAAASGPDLGSAVAARASVDIGGGRGTLVLVQGRKTYGLTAAHCCDRVLGTSRVRYAGGSSGVARWEAVDRDQDIALFSVWARECSDVVKVAAKGEGRLFTINSRGQFQVKREDSERRWDVDKKAWIIRTVWQMRRDKCRKGDSGSGVFQGGVLLGVVTHGGVKDDETLLACPTSEVIKFLAKYRVGARPVGSAPPPENWGDKDRTAEILEIKRRLLELEKRKSIPGPAGRDGTSPDMEPYLRRLVSLETWRSNFRAVVRVKVTPRRGE